MPASYQLDFEDVEYSNDVSRLMPLAKGCRDEDGNPLGILVSDKLRIRMPIDMRDLNDLTDTMCRRQERMIDWVRWRALKGYVKVENPNGTVFEVHTLTPEQKPVATVPWTDSLNCDPIADLRAQRHILTGGDPHIPVTYYMNSRTERLMERADKVNQFFSNNPFFIANKAQRELASEGNIVVVDDGYRDEITTELRQHLEDGEVVVALGMVGDPVGVIDDLPYEAKGIGEVQGRNVRIWVDGEFKQQFLVVEQCIHPVLFEKSVIYLRVTT